MDTMSLADRLWPVTRHVMGLHAAVYKATGGRIGHSFPGAPSTLLLDHVGARAARSGPPR